VKTQERVISKLERVLESRVLDRKRGAAGAQSSTGRASEEPAQATGSEREMDLEFQLRQLEEQLARANASRRGVNAQPEGEQLLVTLGARDSQIRILQEQMTQNARESSREISQLKLRVMELEMLQ
jgi:hypothetical protein